LKEITRNIVFFLILLIHSAPVRSGNATIDSLRQTLLNLPAIEKIGVLNDISKAYWSVSLDNSIIYATEALILAESLGDKKGMADAINRIGNARYLGTEYDEAIINYTRSLEIRMDISDLKGILGSYNNLYLVNDLLGNKEIAFDYINKAVDLSQKMENKRDIAYYSNLQGSNYSDLYDFSNAGKSLERALEIYESISDKKGMASVITNEGNMYHRMTMYDKAQECFFRAFQLYSESGDMNGVASVLNHIGIVYRQLNNHEMALDYFYRSLELYNQIGGIRRGIASVQNNIGIIWSERNDFTKALDYYSQSLQSYEKIKSLNGIATASHNIGILHTRLGNYTDAMESYQRSVDINISASNYFNLANNYNNIGELYFLMKEFGKSFDFLEKALEIAVKINARRVISENYLFRTRLFRETGEFEKSLFNYELYDACNDSIFNTDARENIARLQVRHNRENQLSELELLQKDNEIRKSNIRKQRNYLAYLSGLAILTGLFLIAVNGLYRYRKKLFLNLQEKTSQLEVANSDLATTELNLQKLNSTKDKFFSIIAHDLKNPFTALLGFSETLHHDYKDLTREQVLTYIDIINKSAANLYRLLENLLEWSKSQTGNIQFKPEKISLRELAETGINTVMVNAKRKNIVIRNEIPADSIVYADKNIVSTIIRNLVNNAVKFTHNNGEVVLSSRKVNGFIEVSVKDNGVGIGPVELKKLFNLEYNITSIGTNDEKGTGLGLLLCSEFVKKSGGRLWAESEAGKGSKFTFTIPE
jgi:signal transduction histidine kinase/Tfp pilus assembly protein PilF